MKLVTKRILIPIFAAAIGFSFVEPVLADGHEGVTVSPTGRVRGWYKSVSETANSDADSVSSSLFQASGRIGIMVKQTVGDWTGSGKAELQAIDAGTPGVTGTFVRDAWAKIENDAFGVTVGRQWFGDACVDGNYPIGVGGDDCVGGLVGWGQGVGVDVKGLPVSLGFGYRADQDGVTDTSGFNTKFGINAGGAQVNVIYGTLSTVGNEDRSATGSTGTVTGDVDGDGTDDTVVTAGTASAGSTDDTTAESRLGLVVTYPMDALKISGGFQSGSLSTGSAAGDVDTANTKLKVGVKFSIDADSAVGGFYDITTTTADDVDDTVASGLTVGYSRNFANVTFTGGYYSKSVVADDTSGLDGGSVSGFALGLATNF